MKHFHIELERNGKLTRTWEHWGESLQIGSDLKSDIVLPPPYDAVVAQCHEAPFGLEIPVGLERLRIIEDTDLQRVKWASARERMELARRLGWREPGANKEHSRRIALGLMGLMGIAAMVGFVLVGRGPKTEAPPQIETIFELVQAPTQDKAPEPEPQEQEDVAQASSDKPNPDPVPGGPTESRTVQWQQSTPANVMNNSILDRMDTKSEGMFGEAVDASQENVVDAILSGGNGHLQKGPVGGNGVAGGGDRMAEMGGKGLGNMGHVGWGTGRGNREGPVRVGTNGTGTKIATRAKEIPARPQDVELGGEAGSRSAESILRVIRAHVGGFRYTYEKFLKENPAIGGKISLKFTISPSGDIVAIEVAGSNTGNATLDQEIKDKARRMKFDAIEKGNVTVTYAFVLDRQ